MNVRIAGLGGGPGQAGEVSQLALPAGLMAPAASGARCVGNPHAACCLPYPARVTIKTNCLKFTEKIE